MMNMSVFAVDGCGLAYRDSGGPGTPVVFTHGAGADQAMFAPQAARLAALGHRTVTWDLRGHGGSRPAGAPFTADRALADLGALLRHLGAERPVLVGQSLGGNLVQEYARRDPRGVRALAVIDAAWNAGPLSRAERLLLSAAAPGLALIPERRFADVLATASAATDDGRRYAREVFARMPKREFAAVWRATTDLLRPDPDHRSPVPLCLIRGEHDRTGNIAAAMPRWAAREGVREHVVAGAGHISTLDAPDEVGGVLAAFLDGLPSAPGDGAHR
ncbi:alpha/beta fold hydrolase [Nocardiopsis trehalosi]|uniref:alpha/beta fold hydrolase n=1 Tax=Nocardiopsis trehalosi TaxID=109329 RepID=UPI00082AD4AA|nr:alpha/beta hydrolase [Nocardiopsis trehalosi]